MAHQQTGMCCHRGLLKMGSVRSFQRYPSLGGLICAILTYLTSSESMSGVSPYSQPQIESNWLVGLLPCNVTVKVSEAGGSLVSIVNPEATMSVGLLTDSGVACGVAAEARTRLERGPQHFKSKRQHPTPKGRMPLWTAPELRPASGAPVRRSASRGAVVAR
jgi:hypothetical protein